MRNLLRALQGRSFALLWTGQSLSLLGDRIFQVALAWWVLEKTGSALAMGTVMVLSVAPMLVFLLIGGVMVDRFNRVRLMLISDGVRGGTVALIAGLAYTNTLEIWHIYLLSLIMGFVDAFFQPAYRAILPEITPEDHLTSANSLTSLSGQLSGIVGPAIGALVVAVGGTRLAFALDSLSFVISVLCLLPIANFTIVPAESIELPVEPPAPSSIFKDVREGIAAVAASPWLWVTIGIAGLSNIAYAGPMEVVLPFLLREVKQADVGVLGLFYSVSSLGAIIAAVWMGRIPKLRKRGITLYGAWMIVGIMVALIGLPISIPLILVASFIIGACNSILSLVWVNTLQEFVPRDLMGRVTSVDYLGSFILLPVGFAVGGWATTLIGAPLVFIVGGLLETSLIGLGLLHPKIRSLD